MKKREYFFKRVTEKPRYSVYVVVAPKILTPRNQDRGNYINNMVKYRIGHSASDIFEYSDGYVLIKILVHKRVSELTHVMLRNLTNDIWANNTLRKILGR